jgi:FAD/FMN-containing dehydrogenase
VTQHDFVEQLRARVRDAESIVLHGSPCACPSVQPGSVHVELSRFSGILDLRPADLTCAVRAGTTVSELQSALSVHGLCLPTAPQGGTVGGAYMSHSGMGAWRDWIIGATFMLADGTIAKSGSHAVKSVAGYDVHRFMAGTRGSLAICLELILRVYPQTTPRLASPTSHGQVEDETQIRIMRRAKSLFDPDNKLNPGVWGFM